MTDHIRLDNEQELSNVSDLHSDHAQHNSDAVNCSPPNSLGSTKCTKPLVGSSTEGSNSNSHDPEVQGTEDGNENITMKSHEAEGDIPVLVATNSDNNLTVAQENIMASSIQATLNPPLEQSHSIISVPVEQVFQSRRGSIMSFSLTNLRSIDDIESKLIFIRTISIAIFTVILFLSIPLSANTSVPFATFRTIAYSFLGFVIMENLIRVQCTQRSACDIHEDKLNILDAFIAIIWIVCMADLSTFTSLITVVLAIASPVQYHLLTKTTGDTRMYGTKMRAFYAVKVVLLAVQLNQEIDPKWRRPVLEASKIILSLCIPLIVYGAVMILSNITNIIKCAVFKRLYKLQYLRQLFLSAWLCSNYALSYIIAGYTLKINQVPDESNEFYLLKMIIITGICMCLTILVGVFLIHYILIQNAKLSSVIQLFMESNNEEVETAVNVAMNTPVEHPKIVFEIISQNQYFVRNSESYYVPIATKALLKDTNKSNIEDLKTLEKLKLVSVKKSQTEKLRRPQVGLNKTKDKKDAELCYICCTGSQNAVFMTCGHGGICYNCARVCINKKPQCIECRAPVEGIAYIDEETGLQGVFRSSRLVKVVVNHSANTDEIV